MERFKKPLQLAGHERPADDAIERATQFGEHRIQFTQTRVIEVAPATLERTRVVTADAPPDVTKRLQVAAHAGTAEAASARLADARGREPGRRRGQDPDGDQSRHRARSHAHAHGSARGPRLASAVGASILRLHARHRCLRLLARRSSAQRRAREPGRTALQLPAVPQARAGRRPSTWAPWAGSSRSSSSATRIASSCSTCRRCSLADDALSFLPLVDGALLVVEEGRTKRADVERSLDLIGEERLLGVRDQQVRAARRRLLG